MVDDHHVMGSSDCKCHRPFDSLRVVSSYLLFAPAQTDRENRGLNLGHDHTSHRLD